MLRYIFILFFFTINSFGYATEQIKDQMIYNGKTYYIQNVFLNKTLLSNYVYENFLTNNYFNTALWRGYMATYEIVNNKVVLEDIKINAYHGVLPEEKILGTFYIVNAEIVADITKAAETDDLNDTINYALINDIIHAEMKISSELLEHVAGRIIRKIKSEFAQVQKVKVKITKTKPPMKGEMKGVSVEFEENF